MTSLFENLKMKGGGDRKPGCPNDVHFKLHKTSKGKSQKHSILGMNLLLSTVPRPVIDLWMEIPSFPPPVDSNGHQLFASENKKCFTNFNKNIITFCNYYKSENIVIRIEAPKDNWTKTNYLTTNIEIFDYISSRFSFYEDNGDYTLNYLISQLTTVKNLYFLPYVQGNFSSPPLTTLSNTQDYKDNRDAFWTAVEFTNWYIKNKLSSIKVSSGSLNFKIQLVIEPENMGLPGIKYRDGDAPNISLVNTPNPCAFKGNNLDHIANSVATQINYLFENKDINVLKTDPNYEYILKYMPSSLHPSFAATTGTTGGKLINTVYDTNNKQAVTTIFGQWYNFGSYPPFKPGDKNPDKLIDIFKANIKLANTNKDYYTPLLSIEDGTKRNLDDNAYYGIPSTAYYDNNGSLVFNTPTGYNKAAPPQLADWKTKGKDFTWTDLENVVTKIKRNNFSTSSGSGTIKNVMIFGAHYLERNLGDADVTVPLAADNSIQIEGLGPSNAYYSHVQPYKYNNYGQFTGNLTFT